MAVEVLSQLDYWRLRLLRTAEGKARAGNTLGMAPEVKAALRELGGDGWAGNYWQRDSEGRVTPVNVR